MRALSPEGNEILGTYEMCPARAEISNFSRNPDGSIAYEYAGDSEMFWDGQETVMKDGKVVFLCSDGKEWTEDQIKLVEDDYEDEEEES